MGSLLALDSDIVYNVLNQLNSYPTTQNRTALKELSTTSKALREACCPLLFGQVRWPHPDKFDDESGLHFFPSELWAYFRHFRLIWPDDWPDANPPRWGDRYYVGGDYHPRHIDKLVDALPSMPVLTSFHINCPFYPPNAILKALVHCPSLRSLTVNDTPLYISMVPTFLPSSFRLEKLVLIPVAEALRVGEGPYDPKYAEIHYYIREYRKKYRNDILARLTAIWFLTQVAKKSITSNPNSPTLPPRSPSLSPSTGGTLRHLEVSGDLCTLESLADVEWDGLEVLVLTGRAPRAQVGHSLPSTPMSPSTTSSYAQGTGYSGYTSTYNGFGGQASGSGNGSSVGFFGMGPQAQTEFIDVIARMPKLKELRLLFAKGRTDQGFRVVPACALLWPPSTSPPNSTGAYFGANGPSSSNLSTDDNGYRTLKGASPHVLSRLKYLAMSNACDFSGVFLYATSLERLAISAIIDHPRVPIALGRQDIDMVLNELNRGGGRGLKLLRIMIEDKVNPEMCRAIAELCPRLESLEIELCGYHDGKSIYAWEEFTSAFLPIQTTLHNLRLCIQFPEYDESDPFEPWRVARKECAMFLARRFPTLKRVGFEYRKRTGTHRYEDSWLEWDIERKAVHGSQQLHGLHDAQIELFELEPSWYPFPEVWFPVTLPFSFPSSTSISTSLSTPSSSTPLATIQGQGGPLQL
ncbi:hypothetical protein AX16_000780 [Volvariella volvacea WC 439]|nr:hypothetical protein AX16_000780 [Volvariella volvacea WC 439]